MILVDKNYDWDGGAILEDHTKKKHKILSEYFSEYLRVRCKHPQQSKFRLAIVDGFSGAGKYKEGEYGSPLIFIDTLSCLIKEINCYRTSQGHKSVSIECLIIFNDSCPIAIQKLKENTSSLLAPLKESEKNLQIHCEYLNNEFDKSYSYIKKGCYPQDATMYFLILINVATRTLHLQLLGISLVRGRARRFF